MNALQLVVLTQLIVFRLQLCILHMALCEQTEQIKCTSVKMKRVGKDFPGPQSQGNLAGRISSSGQATEGDWRLLLDGLGLG